MRIGNPMRKHNFSSTKAPKLFQHVWTSPLVEGLGVRANTLSKFLENPTFPDGFDGEVVWHEIGFFGMTGKAAKILFLLNQGSKIDPTCMDLPIGGKAGCAIKSSFKIPWISDFGGRFRWKGSVMTNWNFWITGKAAKILFLVNQSSKIVPTFMDLSIGGRTGPRSKSTFKIPWRSNFRGRFWWKGSVMTNWNFWDDGESSENIISRKPRLQNCSNLYGPLHWWKGLAWKQKHFCNSMKIRILRTVLVGR